MDLAVRLRSLGLEQYEATFRENAITEKVLPRLTAEDLKDLGVTVVGLRSVLLDAILHRSAPRAGASCSRRAPSGQCRAPPSHRDVLRLGRLNGTIGAHGPSVGAPPSRAAVIYRSGRNFLTPALLCPERGSNVRVLVYAAVIPDVPLASFMRSACVTTQRTLVSDRVTD